MTENADERIREMLDSLAASLGLSKVRSLYFYIADFDKVFPIRDMTDNVYPNIDRKLPDQRARSIPSAALSTSSEISMKPVLRHRRTGLYFQGGASWTPNVTAALVYRDVEAALDAAYTSGIAGLELNVLLFDDPRYTLRLRLVEWFGNPDELNYVQDGRQNWIQNHYCHVDAQTRGHNRN